MTYPPSRRGGARGSAEDKPITTMPFGKEKGKPLQALKLDYIQWLLNDFEGLRDPLRRALEAEAQRRSTSDQPDTSAVEEFVRRGAAAQQAVDKAVEAPGEEPIRRIVRQELAKLFRRAAAAMEDAK